MHRTLDLVVIGPSILSSLDNPRAELFRGLINELAHQGHRTTFLEPFVRRRSGALDMLKSPYCEVWTYPSVDNLLTEYRAAIESADLVMLCSGVEQIDRIAHWVAEEARGITMFYDTDLSETVACADHKHEGCRNIHPTVAVFNHFNLYLSTTGGAALEAFARRYGIAYARPLYESIDAFNYYRMEVDASYDLGFFGNHRPERAGLLDELLLGPARTTPNRPFALAGTNYPPDWQVPDNLTHLEHLPDTNRVDFFNRQSCTLILGRNDHRGLGYTPSRRLLAAAACGVPVLTEDWLGLEEVLTPGEEVYCVRAEQDVLDVLYGTDEALRRRTGGRARARVLAEHTTAQRARELLGYWLEVAD